MPQRFHGWIVAAVLGGTTGARAEEAPVITLPPTPLRLAADPAPPPKAPVVSTPAAGAALPPSSPDPTPPPVVSEPVPPPVVSDLAPPPVVPDPVAPPVLGLDLRPLPPAPAMWVDAGFQAARVKTPNAPAIAAGTTPLPAGPFFAAAPIPTSPGFIGLFTVSGQPGALTAENAASIRNGDDLDRPNFGGRLLVGSWLDGTNTFGAEAGYSFLFLSQGFHRSSTGPTALSIPYTDALTGGPTAYPVAQLGRPVRSSVFVNTTPAVFVHLYDTTSTDAYAGSAGVRLTGDFQTLDGSGVLSLVSGPGLSVVGTLGFRYAHLGETLTLDSTVFHSHQRLKVFEPSLALPINGQPVVNDFTSVATRTDRFATQNNFYGGQVGARGEAVFGGFTVGLGVQVALGDMNQSVEVSGNNETLVRRTATPTRPIFLAGIPLNIPAGPPVTSTTSFGGPGGLFAQPTNLGSRSREVFAVIPQGNLRVGYRLSQTVSASVGYNFLYVSSVARPGDQIDYALNPGTLNTPPAVGTAPRPVPQIHATDFWVQGIDLGVQVRY